MSETPFVIIQQLNKLEQKSKQKEATPPELSETQMLQDLQELSHIQTVDEKLKVIQDTNKLLLQEILTLYDHLVFMISLDTVQAKTLKECVPKEIAHQMKTHPEFSRIQAIAVGFSKCRKRFKVRDMKVIDKIISHSGDAKIPEENIERWITVKGRRIPILKGKSEAESIEIALGGTSVPQLQKLEAPLIGEISKELKKFSSEMEEKLTPANIHGRAQRMLKGGFASIFTQFRKEKLNTPTNRKAIITKVLEKFGFSWADYEHFYD